MHPDISVVSYQGGGKSCDPCTKHFDKTTETGGHRQQTGGVLCFNAKSMHVVGRKYHFNGANEIRQLPLLEAVQTCSETAREGGREGEPG